MQFNRELDARGINCPLPILRTKKALNELPAGQVVRVVATDPGTVRDFNAFAQRIEYELVASEVVDREFIFYVRKK
jgi:tRNA 2-thiouridine synthesizing protein A